MTQQARVLSVASASIAAGQNVNVSVYYNGLGDENALGFSLYFDTTRLTFISAAVGSGAAGAGLTINPNQAGQGRLGFILALSAGTVFPAGTRQLVTITFTAAADAGGNSTPINFGDTPTAREMVRADASIVPLNEITFTGGTVTITGGEARVLSVASASITAGQNVNVSVYYNGLGDENALGFSLYFDTTRLTFISAAVGSGAAGAGLTINPNQAGQGRLGFILALSAGTVFPAGTRQLVDNHIHSCCRRWRNEHANQFWRYSDRPRDGPC